ncbi:MAG TPA: FtsX-like permease family protein [Deltaproteobacteria bacterium]|nr:FtsX-like permease family protein [Deltaproteobacteria bacterium]
MIIFKMILKNAFRHKARTGLTVLAMGIAVLAFGLLRTVITTWFSSIEATSANRLVVRNAISLIFPLPLSYYEKIRHVEGVRLVSYGNWFGGVYINEKNFFANFAVEPRSYLQLYPEFVIPEDQKEDFLRDRRGFLAGRKLVERFGWRIGDVVTLKGTIYPGNWDFVLRAIYRGRTQNIDETQFIFNWQYLNETLKDTMPSMADQVGFFVIGITNPNKAADITDEIDAMFKNSPAETLTETEKAFVMGFISMGDAIIKVIQVVSFVIIVIILAVVANTMAMTTRERIGEYAVLKTLGYSWVSITILIMGETLVITLMGAILGIVLTYPAALGFKQALSTFFPVFNVAPATILLDLCIALVVGVAASLIPARQASSIRIAEGLRRIG